MIKNCQVKFTNDSILFEPHLEGLHHLCSTSSFSSAAKDTYISLVEAIYSSPACDSSERGSTNHCLKLKHR